jgi:hypothetical protein
MRASTARNIVIAQSTSISAREVPPLFAFKKTLALGAGPYHLHRRR